jgi:soluble lytic murein transglycosylase-like protein
VLFATVAWAFPGAKPIDDDLAVASAITRPIDYDLLSAWAATRPIDDDLAVASAMTDPASRVEGHGHRLFDELIHRYARRYCVDPALVKAVIHAESGFQMLARSIRGARGLMQVMPGTGRAYGAGDLDDPSENLRAGVRHLRSLLDRYDNDLRLALAAYNAGSAVVERYGDVPPYPETVRYVARVMRYRDGYSAQMNTVELPTRSQVRG